MSDYDDIEKEFTYSFSSHETELMAKFLRNSIIPNGLEKFRDTVIAVMYSSMTIDEAENFFNEKK